MAANPRDCLANAAGLDPSTSDAGVHIGRQYADLTGRHRPRRAVPSRAGTCGMRPDSDLVCARGGGSWCRCGPAPVGTAPARTTEDALISRSLRLSNPKMREVELPTGLGMERVLHGCVIPSPARSIRSGA